jgi:hypothetical protein
MPKAYPAPDEYRHSPTAVWAYRAQPNRIEGREQIRAELSMTRSKRSQARQEFARRTQGL